MDVRLPDGTIVRNVPPGTTQSQLMARMRKASPTAGTGVSGLPAVKSDLPSLYLQGGTFGLSDEVAGLAGALTDAIQAPFSSRVDFNPVKSYQAWRDRARQQVAETRKAHPYLGTALEIAGGLGTAAPAKAVAAAKTLPQKIGSVLFGSAGRPSNLKAAVKAGAKTGAAAGALAGFGYGEGADKSTLGAVTGGTAGATLGAALPIAGRLIARPVQAARDYLNPANGLGRQVVARAIEQDKLTPGLAGQAIQEAQQRGTPLMLGDLGDNLRGLTGSLSRKPGPSRTLIRTAVEERQAGQGDRIRQAIERDLGPIANPHEVSDSLIQQARAAAAPLYEEAYRAPGVASDEITSLLNTPAGKQALGRARSIAANERIDPTRIGIDLDAQGEPILTMVPTMQTLDYVKRGLDDIVEQSRDPVTRRLNLDEAGRAVNGVRAQLLNEMDRLNPAYAQARAAYAGPASANQAMWQGRKALTASADELERMTANLSDADKEQFALGFRTALGDALDRRVDGADKVGALLGTPRKRAALAQLFGGGDSFDRFLKTLADERMANETYRAVATGSQTANRLADDAMTTDQSLLEDLAGAAIKGGLNGGKAGALAEMGARFKDRWNFGAGETGQRAREDAAALLSEIDPDILQKAMRDALRQQARRRAGVRAVDRSTIRAGNKAGLLTGAIIGANTGNGQ